jgi:hypothetical protein
MQAFKLRLTAVAGGLGGSVATSADLPTSAGFWSATIESIVTGPAGDGLTLTIAVESGIAATVEVRDGQSYSASTGAWTVDDNAIGVKIVADATHTVTIGTLEAAINAQSSLISSSVSIGAPAAATIATATIGSSTISIGPTAGSTVTAPTDEALKLTGLGLEVGVHPRLHRRYPRA